MPLEDGFALGEEAWREIDLNDGIHGDPGPLRIVFPEHKSTVLIGISP
jgi:hypothetical protein